MHTRTNTHTHMLTVLRMASSTLCPVVELCTTSSSCMMMSAPIVFCISVEYSGVRTISESS